MMEMKRKSDANWQVWKQSMTIKADLPCHQASLDHIALVQLH